MIDGLTKLGAVMVFFFMINKAAMICVRNRFQKELADEILKVDEKVQMSEGLLPQ